MPRQILNEIGGKQENLEQPFNVCLGFKCLDSFGERSTNTFISDRKPNLHLVMNLILVFALGWFNRTHGGIVSQVVQLCPKHSTSPKLFCTS